MHQILGYLLNRKIAEGSCAEIYEGLNIADKQTVVIKILHPRHTQDKKEHKRLEQEFALGLRLQGLPGLVRVLKFGHAGALPYIVMELVPGKSLGGLVRERKKLTNGEAFRIAGVLGRAVRLMHNEGIYHKDIKSDNVMLDGKETIKLIDFGLSETFQSVKLSLFSRTLEGSIAYLAPELLRTKKPTPASDLYSLGCTLYEGVTGRLPFPGTSGQEILRLQLDLTLKADPISVYNPDISYSMATLIMKAMEKDPQQRYKSAEEFLLELGRNPLSSQFRQPAVPAAGPAAVRREPAKK